MPLWVVGTAHQIVQGHVEVVRQGDEDGKCWLLLVFFVILVGSNMNPDASRNVLLHQFLFRLNLNYAFWESSHINTSKRFLGKSIDTN